MIKQTDKDKLKAMGFDVDAIVTAATSDKEVDITIPSGSILTDEQLTTRDNEKFKDGKKEGEKAALEITKRHLLKEGMEVKAEKFSDLATELSAMIGKDADSKYKTLEAQNLALIADKNALSGKVTELETGINNIRFEGDLLNKFPNAAPGLKSTKETYELAKLRGYDFKVEEGVTTVYKDGKVLTDKATHAPLGLESAISHMYESEGWKQAAAAARTGGRGGQQSAGGTGSKRWSEAMAEWEESNPGKNIASSEGQAFMAEQAKQPGFDMSS